MENINVYKMDGYEWWASKWDMENTYNYFLKNYGLDKEEAPIEDVRECDLDEDGRQIK